MAKCVIRSTAKIFELEMTDEDMERLGEIVMQKKSNYYNVVCACFHAGLIALINDKHCRESQD